MEQKIRSILAVINEEILNYDGKNLLEEEVIDSFDVMQIVEELEEAFKVEFDSEDIISENFASVDSIIQMVKKTIGEKGICLPM